MNKFLFLKASLDEIQLSVLSVFNQVVLIAYQFPFGIGKAK